MILAPLFYRYILKKYFVSHKDIGYEYKENGCNIKAHKATKSWQFFGVLCFLILETLLIAAGVLLIFAIINTPQGEHDIFEDLKIFSCMSFDSFNELALPIIYSFFTICCLIFIGLLWHKIKNKEKCCNETSAYETEATNNEATNTPEDLDYKINALNKPINCCDEYIKLNSKQFEQKITYIGAGAIVSILAFSKENTEYPILLIIGLCVLLLSCTLNFYSYIWANNIMRKDYDEFNIIQSALSGVPQGEKYNKFIDMSPSDFYKYIVNRIDKRNNRINTYNKINAFLLIGGLAIVSIYVIINII